MEKTSITHKRIRRLHFYILIIFPENLFAEPLLLLCFVVTTICVVLSSDAILYRTTRGIFHVPDTVVCEVWPSLLYSLHGVSMKEDSLQQSEAAGLMEQHRVRGERGLKQNPY
jgi:hypothetical protein